MWIPGKVVDWFTAMRVEAVPELQAELAALRAERDALKLQAAVDRVNFDWLRMKVNTLEVEKTALMEKAYGIKLPAPEIVRTPVIGERPQMAEFSFDDLGDNVAKTLGFPTYDKQ